MNIKYLIWGIAIIALASCEKVIDIDLNETNPRIVVQAELWEGDRDFIVQLDYTSSFYKADEQAPITNAVVNITEEETGRVESLEYLDEDIYRLSGFQAKANHTYTLDIELEGELYSSTVVMPNKAVLDSTRYQFIPGQFGQPGGYFIFMYYKDNPEETNFYRALYDLNGEAQRSNQDVYILDDGFTNGSEIEIPLFVNLFELGDTIDLDFVSIDPFTYDYLLTLNTIIGNGQPSAAPANPNSNFSNGALGYFAAYNGTSEQIIIEE